MQRWSLFESFISSVQVSVRQKGSCAFSGGVVRWVVWIGWSLRGVWKMGRGRFECTCCFFASLCHFSDDFAGC